MIANLNIKDNKGKQLFLLSSESIIKYSFKATDYEKNPKDSRRKSFTFIFMIPWTEN